MNQKPGYSAELRANLEPTKGVGRLRQQDGGHGSRNPLRSVYSPAESTSPNVFSLGRSLPPDLGCIPKQPDSLMAPREPFLAKIGIEVHLMHQFLPLEPFLVF